MATKKRASKRAVKVKEDRPEEPQSTPGHPVDTVVDIVDTGEPLQYVAVGGVEKVGPVEGPVMVAEDNIAAGEYGPMQVLPEPVQRRGPVMSVEEFNERYAKHPVGTGPCSECDGLGIIEVGIGLSYSTCPKCRGAGTRHFQEDTDDGRAVAAPAEGEASGEGNEQDAVGADV